ncbi:MAG: hypothetical protein ACLQB1_20180 [Streptosporangiaceae bacterium]
MTVLAAHRASGPLAMLTDIRAVISGTELRIVAAAQLVRRRLSLNGLDRLVSIYPSLQAATTARAPAAVAAEQAHHSRELLDSITTSLYNVGLSLQAAADLPHDAASQGIAQALQHLDDTIRQIRDTAFTTRGPEIYPALRNGAG